MYRQCKRLLQTTSKLNTNKLSQNTTIKQDNYNTLNDILRSVNVHSPISYYVYSILPYTTKQQRVACIILHELYYQLYIISLESTYQNVINMKYEFFQNSILNGDTSHPLLRYITPLTKQYNIDKSLLVEFIDAVEDGETTHIYNNIDQCTTAFKKPQLILHKLLNKVLNNNNTYELSPVHNSICSSLGLSHMLSILRHKLSARNCPIPFDYAEQYNLNVDYLLTYTSQSDKHIESQSLDQCVEQICEHIRLHIHNARQQHNTINNQYDKAIALRLAEADYTVQLLEQCNYNIFDMDKASNSLLLYTQLKILLRRYTGRY